MECDCVQNPRLTARLLLGAPGGRSVVCGPGPPPQGVGGGSWTQSRCEPCRRYLSKTRGWGLGGRRRGGGGLGGRVGRGRGQAQQISILVGPTASLLRNKTNFPDRFAARVRPTMVLPVTPPRRVSFKTRGKWGGLGCSQTGTGPATYEDPPTHIGNVDELPVGLTARHPPPQGAG